MHAKTQTHLVLLVLSPGARVLSIGFPPATRSCIREGPGGMSELSSCLDLSCSPDLSLSLSFGPGKKARPSKRRKRVDFKIHRRLLQNDNRRLISQNTAGSRATPRAEGAASTLPGHARRETRVRKSTLAHAPEFFRETLLKKRKSTTCGASFGLPARRIDS